MRSKFEYLVCQAQQMRITFANGQWQGSRPMDPAHADASMATCPQLWEYLQLAGDDGWELVTANPLGGATAAFTLFLKRPVA